MRVGYDLGLRAAGRGQCFCAESIDVIQHIADLLNTIKLIGVIKAVQNDGAVQLDYVFQICLIIGSGEYADGGIIGPGNIGCVVSVSLVWAEAKDFLLCHVYARVCRICKNR